MTAIHNYFPKRIIITLSTIFIFNTAQQSMAWEVVEDWIDPIAREQVTAATAINNDGFIISIFRSNDDRVRSIFSIPSSSFDRLTKEGRVLMIRPDNHESREAKIEPDNNYIEYAKTDGLSVRDIIWHGSGPTPEVGTLRNILDSSNIFARFYLDNGDSLETSWSLSGSVQAIEEALSINAEISDEDREWNRKYIDLSIVSMRACGISSPRSCLQETNECLNVLNLDRDIEKFDHCINNKKNN